MKSYLKFLSRNKSYTAIEALGLIVSLAFVIVISCYTWQQFAVTREANDYQRLYSLNVGREDLNPFNGEVAIVLDRVPDVDAAGRIGCRGAEVEYDGEKVIGYQDLCEVDPVIFDFFPVEFVSGTKDVLNDRNQVLLDEAFARKISPNIDPVGRTIIVTQDTCTIGGIIRFGKRSILRRNDIYRALAGPDINNSDGQAYWLDLALIRFREGADHEAVRTLIDTVVRRELAWSQQSWRYSDFRLTMPFKEIYFSPRNRCNAIKWGNLTMVYVLIAVGILLLVSALFNYINLSVALAGKRAKEMAIRLALGEQRGAVFRRYIVEAVLFTSACVVLAAVLAKAFVPVFNRYAAGEIGLDIAFSPAYIALYLALALIVGLVSGAIPAAITLSYNPVAVIKGEQRRQTKTVFSRIFIVIQNIITVALISLAVIMELQYNHLQNMPLGADVDGLYFISCQTVGYDQLAAKPYVDKIAYSTSYPGRRYMQTTAITDDGQKIDVGSFVCEKDAFDMFHFGIVRDFQVPGGIGVWLTESAARVFELDYDNPTMPRNLPQYWSNDVQVAGIINDYAVADPSKVAGNQVGLILVAGRYSNQPSVILKLNRFDAEVRADLQKVAEEVSLQQTGDYSIADMFGYVPELIERDMIATRNFISLIELFMLLATLISLLGLVAMSAYYVGLQTRNIAVRKVFGGTVATEARRAVREYMVLVGIAILIGIPIAIVLAQRYLMQFYYRIDGYGWVFAVAAVIALAISFLAVLSQTLKAAKANPAVELKKE